MVRGFFFGKPVWQKGLGGRRVVGEVRGEGATLRVPLDGSMAALGRLESTVTRSLRPVGSLSRRIGDPTRHVQGERRGADGDSSDYAGEADHQ
jgi:hypothetical protein